MPIITVGWACHGRQTRRVRRLLHTRRIEARPLILEILKVRHYRRRRAAADVAASVIYGVDVAGAINDEAVLVGFLEPFVDDGAGPDVGHGAEDGGLVGEEAGFGLVAASLGEWLGQEMVFWVRGQGEGWITSDMKMGTG